MALGNLTDVKLGNAQVSKIYLGSSLVWQKVPTVVPILDLPFQNSISDATGINTMIAGNGNGVPLFTTGRKGNDFAINFTGNRSIKTNNPFPINTDQMTISAWIKRNTTNAGMLLEMGTDASVVGNSFYCYLPEGNTMEIRDVNNEDNTIRVNFNMTNWNHIVIVFNRSLNNQNNINVWVNNSLLGKSFILSGDVNGNYLGKTLYIGQRAGANLPFEGLVQDLKIWNKALTATEITNLYNSEL